jgi:oligopeptide transport system substrate-binding protein
MPRGTRRIFLLSAVIALSLLPARPAGAEPPPVRLSIGSEPGTLDPDKIEGGPAVDISYDLFEGLTAYSATDTVIPGAATSWETSADGLVWIFHLRPDAVWSDGTPLTADDFVYSFRRVVDPATASPYASALLPILNAGEISARRETDLAKLGVAALDPRTLRITLVQATPWFLSLLAIPSYMPVPRRAIEKWGDQWIQPEHMVTNGAFTLKRWVPLGEIDLVTNPRFHDAAAVGTRAVDYMVADDGKAAVRRYEAGELDVINIPGQDLARLKRERPAELRSIPRLGSTFLVINMDGPLGRDPRIVQALSMAIDRDVLEGRILRNDQIPAYGVVPAGIPDYPTARPDWAGWPMAERIAAARKLLAEAGAPTPLKLRLFSPRGDRYDLKIRAIIDMWHAALGIETQEEAVEMRVVLDRLTHRDFEIAYSEWTADYPDVWSFLSSYRIDAGEQNTPDYKNPKFDALLDRSRDMADPAHRLALSQSAEQLILEDQIIIPIDYAVDQLLVNPRLQGYESAPLAVHPSRFLSLAADHGPG